jgi:hypothetical protein
MTFEVTMSDGPHRSLNMNRSWKRLAEYADNEAYSLAEIAGAYIPALEQCCRDEVPDGLWGNLNRIFADQQQALFGEQKVQEITALRASVAGRPLGCALVDEAERLASIGTLGTQFLLEATTRALLSRAARANRQVEEHFYRNSTDRRTKNVRDRMESGLKAAALKTLAERCFNTSSAPISRSRKQADLDDGVQL